MLGPLVSLLGFLIVLVLVVWLVWPVSGGLARLRNNRKYQQRVLREDALKHVYKSSLGDSWPTLESIAGALQITTNEVTEVLGELEEVGLLQRQGDRFQLTWEGEQYALHIIRAHRLWERYLADHTGFGELDWHRQAEEQEHNMTAEDVAHLSSRLGHPIHDPHGDPIPSASGDWEPLQGQTLNVAPLNQTLRIVHIEDEPEVLYAQILAEQLHPGQTLRIVERSPRSVLVQTEGRDIYLAPIVAGNIQVEPADVEVTVLPTSSRSLADLNAGESAVIQRLSPSIRGLERRRLLDLGLLPGTTIQVELVSPSGDPVGYRVRGTLLALRRAQANNICLEEASVDVTHEGERS